MLAAAPVEHRALDLVTARDELLLEPAHEHAEVGVGRPGYICETSRILIGPDTPWPCDASLNRPAVS